MSDFQFNALPVDTVRVTQHFGERPEYYEQFDMPYHLGIDFGVPVGSPVYAVAGGRAIRCDRNPYNSSGYGIYCIIQHDDHHLTKYGHMSSLRIAAGQVVIEGEELGKSGNTGRSSGPHLHLQLEKNHHPLDPWPYLEPLLEEVFTCDNWVMTEESE